jgi:hypothetical protein
MKRNFKSMAATSSSSRCRLLCSVSNEGERERVRLGDDNGDDHEYDDDNDDDDGGDAIRELKNDMYVRKRLCREKLKKQKLPCPSLGASSTLLILSSDGQQHTRCTTRSP